MFDYPPTPNERAVARRNNQRHQLEMFAEPEPERVAPRSILRDDLDEWNAARGCPVCTGPHNEAECPHGTAPTLPDHGSWCLCVHCNHPDVLAHHQAPVTRNPSNPAQVRAMFRSLGWPTQKD
jgi:hypothetical protein